MTKAFNTLVARVVEGQIKSYLDSHPEIAEARIGKLRPEATKAEALRGSIAKRIIRDLTGAKTKARLVGALRASDSGSREFLTCAASISGGHTADMRPPGVAIREASATDWRPISTAPTDGTRILVCDESFVACARYRPYPLADASGFVPDGALLPWPRPLYWMPLPAPRGAQ